MGMDIDYNILKKFIPKEDKKYFLVFGNVYFNSDKTKIICPYRCLLEEKSLSVKVEDYKTKLRISKIEKI